MTRIRLLLIVLVVICGAMVTLFIKSNFIDSEIRTDVKDSDAAYFTRLTGFEPYYVLFVEEWKPSMLGLSGQVTYGAIVHDFSDQALLENGWQKTKQLPSLDYPVGIVFKTLSRFNHNSYARTVDDRPVVIICSPYGDDEYLGQTVYLVIVCASYRTVYD